MRHLTLGALIVLCLAPVVQAQTADAKLMAPIQKFLESFNKGDVAGAAATHAAGAQLFIADEFTPFLWRGPQAVQTWAEDLAREDKKRGITDEHVTIGAATRVETDGTAAYVIVPSVYTFKEKGVPMREAAQMTFVLQKGTGGWLIQGWTWTGPKPQKAGAAAKK